MNKCPTNYPSFHLLFHFLSMVSGGLEPLCHRNSSTFESNNKSETKWKTAAPNEHWHDLSSVWMLKQSLFHFLELLLSKDKVKCMRIKANNDLGHLSRSRISNMETESQKETGEKVSANRSAAAEADQLPDVSQSDQMFQQKTCRLQRKILHHLVFPGISHPSN